MNPLPDAVVARLRTSVSWPLPPDDRYEILEEIGRGGMGTVYLARDTTLGRDVALKVPNGACGTGVERRLRNEACVLARLEHPGIVPVHDVGRLADGRLFYVMKQVRGRTLRDYVDGLDDPGERLRIFERICEPVAFAHANGVIHRDLKPDNVMIGAFGEVMVMDWGVATQPGVDDPADAATVVGTRGFMPPEQARGGLDADARADIYSLGAVLALLTGESRAPKPLRAIAARAMASDPGLRYATVADLVADVARYRAGARVQAHAETWAERAQRFGRTYRTAILLVLGYVIMRAAVAFFGGT